MPGPSLSNDLGRVQDAPAEPANFSENLAGPYHSVEVSKSMEPIENQNVQENRYQTLPPAGPADAPAAAPAAPGLEPARSDVAKPSARNPSSDAIVNLKSDVSKLNTGLPTWNDIKHDQAARDIVRSESAKRNYGRTEDIDFLESIEDLKSIDSQRNPEQFLKKSNFIIDNFIRDDSTQEVNLSGKMKNELLSDLAKINENPSLVGTRDQMFDISANEITTVLNQNTMKQVCNNPDFGPHISDHKQRVNERIEVSDALISDYTHQGEIQQDLNVLDSEIAHVNEQREQLALKDTAILFEKKIDGLDQLTTSSYPVLLEAVLNDPEARNMFTKHLASEYSSENLQFIDDIESYNNNPDRTREEKLAQLQLINNKYIIAGSVSQINLPSGTKKAFEQHFQALQDPAVVINDEVINAMVYDIRKVMKDPIMRFEKNEGFLKYQSTLRDTVLPAYKAQLAAVNSQLKPAEVTALYSQDAVLLDQQNKQLVADRGFKLNNLSVVNKNILSKEEKLSAISKPIYKQTPKVSLSLGRRFLNVFRRRK